MYLEVKSRHDYRVNKRTVIGLDGTGLATPTALDHRYGTGSKIIFSHSSEVRQSGSQIMSGDTSSDKEDIVQHVIYGPGLIKNSSCSQLLFLFVERWIYYAFQDN